MSLDDFFSKKAKKKTRKKQNPQELMDKLTREDEIIKEEPELNGNEINQKAGIIEKEDEWETFDDDKEIDLQNIRISKLSLNNNDESSKQASKNRESRNGNECKNEKKVWASKTNTDEQSASEPTPVPTVEPTVYVPKPLRTTVVSKPNVSSAADFPTLDVASQIEAPKKPTCTTEQPFQIAEKRSNRGCDNIPMMSESTQPTKAVYIPPGLRTKQSEGVMHHDSPKPTNLLPRAQYFSDADPVSDNSDQTNVSNTKPASIGGAWTRGNRINNQITVQLPFRPSAETNTSSGWSRNVGAKTYRETVREKPDFEFVHSNRFAKLSET